MLVSVINARCLLLAGALDVPPLDKVVVRHFSDDSVTVSATAVLSGEYMYRFLANPLSAVARCTWRAVNICRRLTCWT